MDIGRWGATPNNVEHGDFKMFVEIPTLDKEVTACYTDPGRNGSIFVWVDEEHPKIAAVVFYVLLQAQFPGKRIGSIVPASLKGM